MSSFIITWILFEIKLFQTALKLRLFEKFCPLNVKDRVEESLSSLFIYQCSSDSTKFNCSDYQFD